MDCRPEGRRRIERPKLRWIDRVLEDVKKLGVKDLWTAVWDREAWGEVLLAAEAHIAL